MQFNDGFANNLGDSGYYRYPARRFSGHFGQCGSPRSGATTMGITATITEVSHATIVVENSPSICVDCGLFYSHKRFYVVLQARFRQPDIEQTNEMSLGRWLRIQRPICKSPVPRLQRN